MYLDIIVGIAIESLPRPALRPNSRGFTLAELLVVLAIMAVRSTLLVIGFQSILGNQFNSEVSVIANTMVRARAYAMDNNTYVFVGIAEVNASTSASTV